MTSERPRPEGIPASAPEPPAAAMDAQERMREERLRFVEIAISNLLRGGVALSFLVIASGLTMSFYHHPSYLSDPAATKELLNPRGQLTHQVREVLHGAFDFQGRDIILMGLFLLIATPVLRVAVSIIAFAYQRDMIFVCITALVLALLLLSFALGGAGAG